RQVEGSVPRGWKDTLMARTALFLLSGLLMSFWLSWRNRIRPAPADKLLPESLAKGDNLDFLAREALGDVYEKNEFRVVLFGPSLVQRGTLSGNESSALARKRQELQAALAKHDFLAFLGEE